jgi:hypothetical protein
VDLDQLEQGDLVRLSDLPVIVPSESGDELEVEDVPVATGICALISQTCDLVRPPEVEPYVQVAPVLAGNADEWERSWSGGLSPRRFALPSFDEIEYPVLDVRLIGTVDKRVLLEDVVEPVECEFPPQRRARLARWLGRRFARHAFPDLLENEILRHVRARLKDRYNSSTPGGPLARAVEGLYIKYSGESSAVTVLLLVEPGTATTKQLNSDEKIDQAVRDLFGPIFARAHKSIGSWKLDVVVKEPADVNAFELLYEYQEVERDAGEG